MLECVINVSEGRDLTRVGRIGDAAGRCLLDTHSDPDHNRSVLTTVGQDAARAVAIAAVAELDLSAHEGAHPRIGVLDVVPFVPLGSATFDDAVSARDEFCAWAARELELPCFRYGPERSLPDVRRHAFAGLRPDCGPARPHPTAGAVAVGARPPLVAYNLWLAEPDIALARRLANRVRSPFVRSLGLQVGNRVQVSMNLIDPLMVGPADVYDDVSAVAAVDRAELVGLIPAAVLDGVDPLRRDVLDLSESRTIEARLAAAGLAI